MAAVIDVAVVGGDDDRVEIEVEPGDDARDAIVLLARRGPVLVGVRALGVTGLVHGGQEHDHEIGPGAEDTWDRVLDHGGHGGVELEVVEVPLVLAGAGIRPGGLVSGARLEDVAPTIAALLGMPAPGHSDGLPLVDALAIDGAPAAEMLADARARRAALHTVLDAIGADDDERAMRTTWYRAGLGLAMLAALIAGVAIAARRHIIVVDRRILSIAVPAFPLTFYGMVLAVEQYLSPSMLPSSGHLEHKLWLYGAIAAGAHLLAAWAALHERHIPRDRLAAAAGLAWVGLIVALAPAFAAWALVGQVSGSALPSPNKLLMAPVTYSVVAAYACATALALVIEHVVFVARATAVYRSTAA